MRERRRRELRRRRARACDRPVRPPRREARRIGRRRRPPRRVQPRLPRALQGAPLAAPRDAGRRADAARDRHPLLLGRRDRRRAVEGAPGACLRPNDEPRRGCGVEHLGRPRRPSLSDMVCAGENRQSRRARTLDARWQLRWPSYMTNLRLYRSVRNFRYIPFSSPFSNTTHLPCKLQYAIGRIKRTPYSSNRLHIP